MPRSPRLILIGTILGSGAVFVEGFVTTVALPAIARDFHLGIAGLQWVLNGYMLTLSALILLGGALGDRFSRRGVFAIGLAGFSVASIGCALAQNLPLLVVARVLQGAAGALVVPNSLALLESSFSGEERGAAVGHWAAWSAVSAAFGPLVGGWLVDVASWRWVFACIAPFAAAAVVAVGVTRDAGESAAKKPDVDYAGAALVTLGLAGVVGALIVGPDAGFTHPVVLAALIGGGVLLVAFVAAEWHASSPLLPLDIFRVRQFTGVNATTLVVYAALNGLSFLLMLQLQTTMRYSALRAGASLLPMNAIMLMLSPVAGRAAARAGPRRLMVGGSLLAAGGMLLFARVRPGVHYVTSVLPAVVVFGIGLACFVAPLTSVALAALGDERAGLASGVNNAVARLAGLLAVAGIPLAAGLGGLHDLSGAALSAGFTRAMFICAALCAAGSAIAAITIRSGPPTSP
jgi:EmrB/QacA subfamily drug resistance transporter